MTLKKKDTNSSFWPRLTRNNVSNQHIQKNWNKWVEEDEEEENNYDLDN